MQGRGMNIHTATLGDVPKLVQYGAQFWHQTMYYKQWGIEYDVATVTRVTESLLDSGIVLYAELDSKIVGLMLCMIGPFPMNENYTAACEWVFYVDPSVRKAGTGQQMITEAERLCEEKGVKFLALVSLSNVHPEAAEGLYKSLGYVHAETTFIKEMT